MRFDAETVGDKRAITFLRKLGKEGQKAITRATNNTGRKARTLSSREIRNDVRLSAAYVRKRLKIQKATFKRNEYVIRAATRGVLMTRYPHRELARGGVSVGIKKGGARQKLSKAFVTELNAGNRRVRAIAVPDLTGAQGGKRARYATGNLKIRVLYAPSVSQVFNDVRDRITPEVERYYVVQMDKEINQAIRRIGNQ